MHKGLRFSSILTTSRLRMVHGKNNNYTSFLQLHQWNAVMMSFNQLAIIPPQGKKIFVCKCSMAALVKTKFLPLLRRNFSNYRISKQDFPPSSLHVRNQSSDLQCKRDGDGCLRVIQDSKSTTSFSKQLHYLKSGLWMKSAWSPSIFTRERIQLVMTSFFENLFLVVRP